MTQDKLQDLRGRMGQTTDNLLRKVADDALRDIALQQAMQNQLVGHEVLQPGYAEGKSGIPKMTALSNIIPNAIGGLASAYQYFDAANQDIKVPDIYSENPYASTALLNLAGIKINPYESMREMYGAERRNNYALRRTGGLTGGQKYAAQVASGIGTQENIAKTLNSIQAQNNQYKTAYNQALLQAGEATAGRRMTANQFREEMAAKAHAAKLQQKQMGMRNFMDYINNYAANEYKRKTGNAMLDLYQQQLDMDKAKMEWMINNYSNPTTLLTTAGAPVVNNQYKLTVPEYKFFPSVSLGGNLSLGDYTLPQVLQGYQSWQPAYMKPIYKKRK